MPFGSELVCWPDSSSEGAPRLKGGSGSEMGQEQRRGGGGCVGGAELGECSNLNQEGANAKPHLLPLAPPTFPSPQFQVVWRIFSRLGSAETRRVLFSVNGWTWALGTLSFTHMQQLHQTPG